MIAETSSSAPVGVSTAKSGTQLIELLADDKEFIGVLEMVGWFVECSSMLTLFVINRCRIRYVNIQIMEELGVCLTHMMS